MQTERDTRLAEFLEMEQLLYGYNYQVWFNLYGPSDPNIALIRALKSVVSIDCSIELKCSRTLLMQSWTSWRMSFMKVISILVQ